MTLTLTTVACLADNYAFIIGNPATKEAAVIDVPEAAPINAALLAGGWRLTTVLLTHHHWDHIDGLDGLANRVDLHIIGAAADAHRLPPLNTAVAEGDTIHVCGEDAQILDVSGHTVGHIAFHFAKSGFVFTADSLMALGCGRLLEGTPEQMWGSMQKLRALPPETIICSGHEYTATNAAFALTLEPDNANLRSRVEAIKAARINGEPTVPSTLALEQQTNPFLRADVPALKHAIGMDTADSTSVFTQIRARKDRF